jgi:hypothetical protein
MHESEADIAELQGLIDRSFERAGAHTLSIIRPDRRLTARQVVKYLDGMKEIVVGTVTSKGEPRLAPVDGHFLRGRFWFGTDARAFRIRHLRRNPAISACHLVAAPRLAGQEMVSGADELGIVVHGRAVIFGREDAEGEAMRQYYARYYGSDPYTWGGEIAWVRIDPEIMTTFAADASRYPE